MRSMPGCMPPATMRATPRATTCVMLLFLFVLGLLLMPRSSLLASDHALFPDDMKRQIDELFLAWDTAWTPGVALAVVQDGRIAYANGYGFAHLEYDIPITPSTIFHIASVSKQFTTFCVLLLEADGKLTLDDELHAHIPELPDFGFPITLRQLAHNISGIRDQWNLLGLAGWRLDDVITTEQILRLLSRQQELNFPPGEEYMYSNSGFTLLAEVVARVSGQAFADFARERIFEPLGMQSSLFYDDHERIVRNRAYSYAERNGAYRKRVLSYATAGATSLFTTVEDLSLWAMNFESPVVGNQSMMEAMNNRGVLNDGSLIDYALGQSIGRHRGLPMIGHGGADAGYRTFLARFPEQGVAIVVFSNDAGFRSQAMAMSVADIVLADHLEEEVEEKPDIPAHSLTDHGLLARYEGHFRERPDNHIIFEAFKDSLTFHTSANREPRFLIPVSDSAFVSHDGRIRFEFVVTNEKQVDQMRMIRNGERAVLPRVEAFEPAQVDLEQYTGRFYSEELDITYTLETGKDENGKKQLFARQLRIGDIGLQPLTPDLFSGDKWFASRFRFEKDAGGQLSGFWVSGSRARRIYFEKRELPHASDKF